MPRDITDTRVLAFVNSLTKTSFQTELSVKIDTTTEVDVTIASLYDTDRTDIEIDCRVGETEFVLLGASGRFDTTAYRDILSLTKDFDILHTHYNFSGSMARLLCSMSDIKIVNTEHANHQYYSFLQRAVNFPSFAFSDAMIFNSESTRDSLSWYTDILIDDKSSYVIYNGIDTDKIDRAQAISKPDLPDGRIILSACRMVSVKNLHTLIHAVTPIIKEHPDVSLVLIGDGPEKKKLQQLSAQLGVDEHIHFPGYLNREEVYSAMHRSDIFAVSSYDEGFCNAAVEAMSCGLPVVASDIGVLHEVINDGGRFADPHCPEEFADELQALLRNEGKLKSLANTAKTRARKKFPIERTVNKYTDVYRRVLD